MKIARLFLEMVLFLAIYLSAYALYQLPEAPTKFIYYNF